MSSTLDTVSYSDGLAIVVDFLVSDALAFVGIVLEVRHGYFLG